ncbi:MAG: hypothetical protein DCC67_14745, partial [Planctomycetota bacterium]
MAAPLLDWAETSPSRVALLLPGGDAVREVTWEQLTHDVLRMAAYLRRSGVERADRVVLWSDNRYEWIVIDLAILLLGAVHVPLHGSLSPPAAAAQIAHAEPKMVIVSSEAMVAGLQRHTGGLALQRPIEVIEGGCEWLPLLERTANLPLAEGDEIVAESAEQFDPEAITTILYSSGTSGEPKAVALTQANLISNCRAIVSVFEEAPDERRLNFLPFSHIYARTCDLYGWLTGGSQLALARGRETVYADCQATRPTMLNAVPFFYDRVMQTVLQSQRDGAPVGIRDLLGPRIRMCISGGAPLPVSTFDFFHQHDVPLLPGYGLTESSPVISMSTLDAFRRGAVGKAIPGIEVRFADDGELLTRGPHVMKEYWKDPKLTRETIRDGWLYTGDLGAIDEDGYIYITGRKKELLALSTGKKAVPTYIESLLCRDPLIQQAMVVGNDRPFLAAIVVPNMELLRERLTQPGADPNAAIDLQAAETCAPFQQAIAQQLRDLLVREVFALPVLIGMLSPVPG